jgi:hypothetical protein
MGARNRTSKPAVYHCVPRDDEPHFVLLGRDPHAYQAVLMWANIREQAIRDGLYPESDMGQVTAARQQAMVMKGYCEAQQARPAK